MNPYTKSTANHRFTPNQMRDTAKALHEEADHAAKGRTSVTHMELSLRQRGDLWAIAAELIDSLRGKRFDIRLPFPTPTPATLS